MCSHFLTLCSHFLTFGNKVEMEVVRLRTESSDGEFPPPKMVDIELGNGMQA